MTTKLQRTRSQDPATIRADAFEAGREDARKAYPRPSSSDSAVTDYFGVGAEASARTAAALHDADHLAGSRTQHDRAVAEKTAAVVRDTGRLEDALFKVSATDHEVQAFKRLPLAARRTPWPPWLRAALLAVMALGSGAALSGALLELTSDEPYYVWGFCLAVTLAVVALGAFVARVARDFEYNRLEAGQFTSGALPKVVLAIGASFGLLLIVALTSIRGTAAEADAARQSRANDGMTVILPGQPVDMESPSSGPDDQALLPSVPAYAYGLLEGLLLMAAFGVEFINYLPWAEQRHRAEKALQEAERELGEAAHDLSQGCGQLMAALSERADHDAAVLIAGEATQMHALAEISDYRRALLSHRPTSQGGDPFQRIDGATSHAEVTTQVAERWGRDLQPADLISADPYDRLEVDQLAPTALTRGLVVLAMVPQRAKFMPVTWDPASLTKAAPIGVKPADPARSGNGARR